MRTWTNDYTTVLHLQTNTNLTVTNIYVQNLGPLQFICASNGKVCCISVQLHLHQSQLFDMFRQLTETTFICFSSVSSTANNLNWEFLHNMWTWITSKDLWCYRYWARVLPDAILEKRELFNQVCTEDSYFTNDKKQVYVTKRKEL